MKLHSNIKRPKKISYLPNNFPNPTNKLTVLTVHNSPFSPPAVDNFNNYFKDY